ncbi:hypothetical protein [Mucilaginibacter sp. BT774]|uniref:hypothetical protein n=1 Tax=Mucilaginibacter sp. BT774 TaxID=3062276 RepID=UPI0026754B8C|nr:hypothetical protein [Mucilaginibacter sp. BT774]MDO3624976.1 hypothetical protein [Mucilaginibacter sp. BT774]
MKTKDKPIKKASRSPVTEAKGHPDGPGLTEMINGEEEKELRRKKEVKQGGPSGGPIPVIRQNLVI